MDEIIEIVSRVTGVTIEQMKAKGRKRRYSDARKIFFLMAKNHTRFSLLEIGEYVNREDHAVVHYGIRTIENTVDKVISKMIKQCEEQMVTLNIDFPNKYEKPKIEQLQQLFRSSI